MFAPVGEVSVNPGGEPERDDSGLPPVDIEIPDDARELDRDMQAYYREERARRREQRGRRLQGSLAKDGIILPLLACCLILALITGTLLTVFTATSDQLLPNTQGTGLTPDIVAGPLPPATATVTVGKQAAMPVSGLRPAALILVPPQCDCAAALTWLIGVVTEAGARPYLLYTASTRPEVDDLYSSLSSGRQSQTIVALESGNLVSSVPSSLPVGGLRAILLASNNTADYATRFSPQDDMTGLIQSLSR
jgi:hypothetical protein